MPNFVRISLSVPASGQTETVEMPGSFIAVEDAEYPGGASATLISVDSEISNYAPAIKNAEYRFCAPFNRITVHGRGASGTVSLLVNSQACAGYSNPSVALHPLASENAVFIFDANHSYGSLGNGAELNSLVDSSGNGLHFNYAAGGKATVVRNGSPSGAVAINLPDRDSSYVSVGGQIIPVLENNQAMQTILVMNGGNVSNADDNYSIISQGGNTTSNWRLVTGFGLDEIFHSSIQNAYRLQGAGRTFDNSWVAMLMNIREDLNGRYLHWNETGLTAFNSPGNIETGTGTPGDTTIGNDANLSDFGCGNSGHRLAFLAMFLYNNSGFSIEPLTYAADVYGITI